MRKTCALATVAVLVAALSVGCNSFLTGDKLSSNPNKPVTASADQLLIGIEVNLMANWEAYPMNLLPLWAQQIQGVQRQWQSYSNYGSGTDNQTADGLWKPLYGGGGLADIRRAEAALQASPGRDGMYGELQVIEALNMGTAADIWGDIPYDSALRGINPVFDKQSAVYAHVQALLDSAITALNSGGGGAAADLFFQNDFSRWAAAAHTLKARFYMHTAETGPNVYDPTVLQKVKDETTLGIADTAGSWRTIHTPTTGEQNLFYDFLQGARKGDVEPSAIHIALLKSLNDNVLLAATYVPNNTGQYVGSAAGASVGSSVSNFAIGVDQSLGIVTYAENILLAAEADYRLGNVGLAGTELNSERAAYGEAGPAVTPGGTNGLLVGILEEKYVRLFLNPEVFFDYLRTCVPNIPLPADKKQPYVQARMPYGYTEQITNTNFPFPGNAPQPSANANFPKLSVDPSGATCVGQVGRTG